jgi:ABC-type uncharacterized transport system involved in gliding motility auxiliary subunit
MILDPFTWAGLAGLFFLVLGGAVYGVRGEFDAWPIAFLALAVAGIGVYLSRHFKDVKQALLTRRARYGANSLVLTAAVLALAVFFQAILHNHNASWDLTSNRINTLADETQKVIQNLAQPVELKCFFADQGRQNIEALVKRMKEINPGKFSYAFINPNKSPLEAQQYSVRAFETTVVICGGRNELVTTQKEEDLVNAIAKLSSGGVKTIYFLTGHQELNLSASGQEQRGASEFKKALENSNYAVKEINLVSSDSVPADCSALILAGPQTDYVPGELDRLKAYLARGGRLLAMLDPRKPVTGLKHFLAQMGAKIGEDVVVDPLSALFGTGALSPVSSSFEASHPIFKDLQLQAVFPLTRSIGLDEKVPGGVKGTVLVKSNPSAWAYTGTGNKIANRPGPKDVKGPVGLGVALEVEPKFWGDEGNSSTAKALVVIYGTSEMATNRFLPVFNNQDVQVNTLRWMCADESRISIKPRDPENSPMILSETRINLLWVMALFIVPGLILVTGVVVAIRRRRTA